MCCMTRGRWAHLAGRPRWILASARRDKAEASGLHLGGGDKSGRDEGNIDVYLVITEGRIFSIICFDLVMLRRYAILRIIRLY